MGSFPNDLLVPFKVKKVLLLKKHAFCHYLGGLKTSTQF